MDDLFSKYHLTIDRKGLHLYWESLETRDLSLECTTPVSFSYKDAKFEETSWKKICPQIINFLFSLSSKTEEEALLLRTDWTKQPFFYKSNIKSNLMPLKNGLYLNCNFTAIHFVWCLQDCLDFFNIPRKECVLIIHRPCAVEPEEIREYFKKQNTEKFRIYLAKVYGYSDERIDKVIKNIDFCSRHYLPMFSKSYDDFLLFDSPAVINNYIQKAIQAAEQENVAKITEQVKRYMMFLQGFYKALY